MSSASASGGTSTAGGAEDGSASSVGDVDRERVELETLADHDLGSGIVDLVLHLVAGERRVDGRHRGAQAPGGEQRDDELEPVRQGDRDDVAGADAEARQPRGGAGDPVGEGRVVELDGVVGDRRRVGLGGGARFRQRGQRNAQGGVGYGHALSSDSVSSV